MGNIKRFTTLNEKSSNSDLIVFCREVEHAFTGRIHCTSVVLYWENIVDQKVLDAVVLENTVH